MKSKFTNDPVLILLTKIITHYEMCKKSSISFEGYDEYLVVSELLNTIKDINGKKPKLKVIK
jgi:hypothetical protein